MSKGVQGRDGGRERERSLYVCGGGCRPTLLTSIIWTHRPELMTRVRHGGRRSRCRWKGEVAAGHRGWRRKNRGGGGRVKS